MNININKGMYIEELINRTIEYYWLHDIAFLEKRFVPYKLLKKINEQCFVGKLLSKSTVDYAGTYLTRHIEFEAKETEKEYFDLSLVKKHQYSFLKKIKELKAISFIIIYFSMYDRIFCLTINAIENILNFKHNKKLSICDMESYGFELEIVYPGILNLTDIIKKLIH